MQLPHLLWMCNVMIIISMVVSFYFGTQHEKNTNNTES